MSMHTSILVVGLDAATRSQVALSCENKGYLVRVADSARAAEDAIRGEMSDMLIVDSKLPDRPGIEFLRELRRTGRTRNTPVIVLTAEDEREQGIRYLDSGADDYVMMPLYWRELVSRMEAVLRRSLPEKSRQRFTHGPLSVDLGSCEIRANGRLVRMGPSEYRLLSFFICNARNTHTRIQLLDRIWGDHVFHEDRTIDVHVMRTRRALKPYGLDWIIETVRGVGYRMAPVDEVTTPRVS